MATLTPEDLSRLKDNADFTDRYSNSTDDTTLNADGLTVQTITGVTNYGNARFDSAIEQAVENSGYEPPLDYSSSIGVSVIRASQTVEYLNYIYAPRVAELPFNIPAIFDSSQWRIISQISLNARNDNRIMDPMFRFWDEQTTSTATGYVSTVASIGHYNSATCTGTKYVMSPTDLPSIPECTNAISLDVATGGSGASYAEVYIPDARSYSGKQVTLSFYSSSPDNLDVNIKLRHVFNDDSPTSIDVGVVSLTSGVFTRNAITFNVPSVSSASIDEDTSHLLIEFYLIDATVGNQTGNAKFTCIQIDEGINAQEFRVPSVSSDRAYVDSVFQIDEFDFDASSNTALLNMIASTSGRYFIAKSIRSKMLSPPAVTFDTSKFKVFSTSGSSTSMSIEATTTTKTDISMRLFPVGSLSTDAFLVAIADDATGVKPSIKYDSRF